MLVQLKLLIVEDSVSYAIELEQLASDIGYSVMGSVDNSAEALDIIFSDQPDIILMDINIKGRLSGIDIAMRIQHLNIPVLYITSFNDQETYEKALESNLVGYVVKPVDKLTLATSLKLLVQNMFVDKQLIQKPKIVKKEGTNFIFFMKNNVYHKVSINDIAFVKSENNYCNFILNNKDSYLLRITLNEVDDLLKHYKFIRCHRQYIINQEKIEKVNIAMNTIEAGGQSIPFSRSKKQEILEIAVFLK